MASLVKHQSLYYFLQFYDGQRSPKRHQVALRVRDKRNALKLQRALGSLFALGKYNPWVDDAQAVLRPEQEPEDLLLTDAMSRFLEAKRQRGRAESTIKTYEYILRHYAREHEPTVDGAECFCYDSSVVQTLGGLPGVYAVV